MDNNWNNQNQNQWNQQNPYGQQYQNNQGMNGQWNPNGYGQQYQNNQGFQNQVNPEEVQAAWGANANQDIYGRAEQNNLQMSPGYKPYKKSKAGLFITIGVLGVIVAVIAAIILIAKSIIGGGGMTEEKARRELIDDSMVKALSFELEDVEVGCIGLTSADATKDDYNNYLAFMITNNRDEDIEIKTNMQINDFDSLYRLSNNKGEHLETIKSGEEKL